MIQRILAFSLIFLMIPGISTVFACTNLIVTKGASTDGSVMITYAADSHTRYGTLGFFPAADHKPGDLCEVYHYENGKLMGTIPEVAHTFSVVQFMNDNKENKVRATKGAANALMAKVWAQRADRDYAKVITYCNAVINSSAGYKLQTNYAELFDGAHYMNDESILEISFLGGDWDVSNWGVQLFTAPEDGWQKYCVPSKDLLSAYSSEKDLVRQDANIVFWDNPDWADENWDPCQDPNVKVPFNYKQKHPDGWNSGDHPVLLRLADIILLKAEAQNETGDISGALASLNLVRKRVGLANQTASTKEDLRAKILKERRLELAFEGHRFDDLVRLGIFVSTMNGLNDFKYTCGGGVQSTGIKINYNANNDKILCPIPQRERDTNPNLTQNPGYN